MEEGLTADLAAKCSLLNAKAPAFVGRKENLNIVFIGHVDSGKSTTAGHILCLTGMVDKRTLEKLEKDAKELGRDSWLYAFALDTDDDEKQKGITVACGKAYFETEKRKFTILDAPGHKNYVPSMISGAAQADVAVLIISARRGEFETGFERGGQTREHAMLIKTLGIKKVIVAVNKMDESSVCWSKDRYDEICDRIGSFLKAIGFAKSEIEFIPISGYTGLNLREPLPAAVCSWYQGKPLLAYLDEMPMAERDIHAPFLMPIVEKFKDNGMVIGGKIESGQIARGQQLLLMPCKKVGEVLGIFYEEIEMNAAYCGDNIKLKLRGIEEEDVLPGSVACEVERPMRAGCRFHVQLAILACKNIVSIGYKAIMHVQTCQEEVTFLQFLAFTDKKSGQLLPRRPFAREGDFCEAVLGCSNAICVEEYAKCPALGRLSLRDEGKTVAMGKILRIIS